MGVSTLLRLSFMGVINGKWFRIPIMSVSDYVSVCHIWCCTLLHLKIRPLTTTMMMEKLTVLVHQERVYQRRERESERETKWFEVGVA